MALATATSAKPVYEGYFADPFVWKHEDTYYAVGTGVLEAIGRTAGNIFPLLLSPDLIHWNFLNNALVRPDPALGETFWAPAVTFEKDTFYLYYSVGHGDKYHQLRVGASRLPQGPYEDLGKTLNDPDLVPFAIDPHPFQDTDEQWYLFYACDFLDCSGQARAGTALMAQ